MAIGIATGRAARRAKSKSDDALLIDGSQGAVSASLSAFMIASARAAHVSLGMLGGAPLAMAAIIDVASGAGASHASDFGVAAPPMGRSNRLL